MILEEWIKEFQKLIETNPEAAKYEVVYAVDEEGNAFKPVYYGPTIGSFDPKAQDFHDPVYIKEVVESGEAEESDFPINAVCIN